MAGTNGYWMIEKAFAVGPRLRPSRMRTPRAQYKYPRPAAEHTGLRLPGQVLHTVVG